MSTKTSAEGLDDVSRWRCEQLVESGFAPALADTIGKNGRYDLHALIQLVDRGCHPELAVRILAPVEEESTG
jgi:hypothetical protein